jgi:hypothetical protein
MTLTLVIPTGAQRSGGTCCRLQHPRASRSTAPTKVEERRFSTGEERRFSAALAPRNERGLQPPWSLRCFDTP